LKIGMALLSINGIPMTNLTATDAIKMIKETEDKLVLTADNFVPAQITFKMGLLNAEGKRNGTMVERDTNKATPTMFKEAGFPSETFRRVYKLVESELLPIAYENYKHTTAYNVQIQGYIESQMVKGGLIGFGQESKGEKKVFQMVKQATVMQSSVDMKAAQVKDIEQTPCLQNTTLWQRLPLKKLPSQDTHQNNNKETWPCLWLVLSSTELNDLPINLTITSHQKRKIDRYNTKTCIF